LIVQELMDQRHPFVYVDELVTKARAVIRDFGLRMLPIVEENRRLVGVISRGDVMTISSSISPIKVKGVMSNPKLTATFDMDVETVTRRMIQLDEWYVPVVKSPQNYVYLGVFGLENFISASLKKNSPKFSRQLSEIASSDVIVCDVESELDNVWRLMQQKRLSGFPVTKKGKLVGIVTQKDLLESGALFPTFESKKGRFKSSTKVSAVMKTPVISLKPTNTVKDAAELMLNKNIGRLPIVNNKDTLVGIVDREDVVRAIL
jgi:CBS domain-containing protein